MADPLMQRPLTPEPPTPALQLRRGTALAPPDGPREIACAVAAELPVAFVYNGTPFAVMMATPDDLEDFARGFSLAEAILRRPAEILGIEVVDRGRGIELAIAIPERRHRMLGVRPRNLAGRSGCGLCGVASLDQALRPLPVLGGRTHIAAAAICAALTELPRLQALNNLTRAVHAAAWFDPDGRPLLLREDVGRHNALDKLIGARVTAGLGDAPGFAVITSRLSVEMVQKAATVGIEILIALSAPSTLAIDLARDCGLTVAARARDGRFDLWSHPERVVGNSA